jgi:hypothetical protein
MYSSRRYLPHKVKVLIEDIKSKLPGEIERLEGTLKDHTAGHQAD